MTENLGGTSTEQEASFSFKKSKKKHKNEKQEKSSPARDLDYHKNNSPPPKKKKKLLNENLVDQDEDKTKEEKPKDYKNVNSDTSQEYDLLKSEKSKKKKIKHSADHELNCDDNDEIDTSHKKKKRKSDNTDCQDIIQSHSTDGNESESDHILEKHPIFKKIKKHKVQINPASENESSQARKGKERKHKESCDGFLEMQKENRSSEQIDTLTTKKEKKSDGDDQSISSETENCSIKKKKCKKSKSETCGNNVKNSDDTQLSDQLTLSNPKEMDISVSSSENEDNENVNSERKKKKKSNRTSLSGNINTEFCIDEKFNSREKKIFYTDNLSRINKLNEVFSEIDYERPINEPQRSRARKFSVRLTLQNETLDKNMPSSKLAPVEEDPDKNIDEHLEAINEEKLLLTDEKSAMLMQLEIMIPWEIPPLHLIETSITGRLMKRQKAQIDAMNITVKTGNFSKEEDQQLIDNWKMFCKMHNVPLDPKPFLSLDMQKRYINRRLNFVRFLAHGLENRLLSSVYRRFRTLNISKEVKTGKFTEKEDQIIIDYIKTHESKKPYADLAALLNRTRGSIEKRCSKLISHKESAIVKWDRNLTEIFVKNLVEITNVKDVSELKNRNMTDKEWKELSESLGILPDKVKRGWLYTIYPRIFITNSTHTTDIKKKLIQYFIEKGIKDWRVINWNEVAEEFEGMTPRFLHKLLKDFVGYNVPANIQDNFEKCLDYIREKILPLDLIRGKKIKKLKVVDNRTDRTNDIEMGNEEDV